MSSSHDCDSTLSASDRVIKSGFVVQLNPCCGTVVLTVMLPSLCGSSSLGDDVGYVVSASEQDGVAPQSPAIKGVVWT